MPNHRFLHRYFIHLTYNGSAYHGWQRQLNAHSVQEELEKCLSLKLGQPIGLTGCGRTDTGVHARSFYAHFDLEEAISDDNRKNFISSLNQFLPNDIAVFNLIPVSPDANARFDASSRTYHYYISRTKNPFQLHTSYYVYGNLDINAMQTAADILKEYTDFTSFSKLHSQTHTNLCTIFEADWKTEGDMLVFRISANRFLRNMVRAITGTLLDVGKGKLSIEAFRKVIEAKDRGRAGFSVPAHGLFLEEITYPEDLFL